ncbi:enoyl-CoA hydratase [Arthrobacter ginkgonis]|uniref:Enoyl-CoA hydratase n=1 Tax=Arthrobacter ginkgonis TaxID=1630594 RepID=A0ABP7C769_9MICC
MSANDTLVRFTVEGRILRATLSLPGRRNALSDAMLEQLVSGVRRHQAAQDIRALMLDGDGGSFCAGRDLSDQADDFEQGPAQLVVTHRRFADLMVEFAELPVVKIAVIEGYAVGAGWSLAAACDLRYAASDAVFSIPELSLGYPFGMGGVARLVRHLGLARAAELVLSGRRFGAEEALGHGFLSNVGPLEDHRAEAVRMADVIASRPALVLAQTARELRDAARSLVAAADRDVEGIVLASLDEECRQTTIQYATRFSRKQAS